MFTQSYIDKFHRGEKTHIVSRSPHQTLCGRRHYYYYIDSDDLRLQLHVTENDAPEAMGVCRICWRSYRKGGQLDVQSHQGQE